MTSTYFEGTTCPLAQYRYSQDKQKGKLQIIFGLLCNTSAWTIAVEVFEGKIDSDLASLQLPDYLGERLIACGNPFLASLRAATSEALRYKQQRNN